MYNINVGPFLFLFFILSLLRPEDLHKIFTATNFSVVIIDQTRTTCQSAPGLFCEVHVGRGFNKAHDGANKKTMIDSRNLLDIGAHNMLRSIRTPTKIYIKYLKFALFSVIFSLIFFFPHLF